MARATLEELGDTVDASASPKARPDGTDELDALDHPALLPVDRRHYLIDGEIAKGGMGRVLAARDLRLGRPVAIKELLPRSRDAAHRFEQEARITARLQHPAIIHIYEAGVWPDGEAFYAMPRVRGRSLDRVVAEQRGLDQRLGLLAHVIAAVDALAYAHSQRVIHRDLKPANVLIGDFGETVVIDWGLAKDLASPAEDTPRIGLAAGAVDTVAGAIVGTPAYMPPEQARGEIVDERADVYALGALLYHVLTGEAPYRASNAATIVDQVLAGAPPSIHAREPRLPNDLVAVVEKAMARTAAERYADAGALAQDLKRFHTGQLVGAHRYSVGERVRRWVRRHRAIVGLATIAFGVLVAIGAVSLSRVLEERQRALDAKQRAEERRAALLEERGRTELLDGHAGRALVYLQGAMASGRVSGAIPFLVADALRPFEALVATAPTGGAVTSVAASPDGELVVIAGRGGALVLATDDLAVERRLFDGVTRVARFDPAGARIVTGGDDGVLRVWDAATGAALRALGAPTSAIVDLDVGADGTIAVGHVDGTVRVWATDRDAPVEALARPDAPITAIDLAPDGARVVVGSADGTASVWTLGGMVWPLRGHRGPITAARFRPDGAYVVTASSDHRAVVWDPDTGKQLVILEHRAGVSAVAWSPDGARLVTASADHTARLWALPEAEPDEPYHALPLATLEGHSDIVVDVRLDAAGARIATTSRDRSLRLWDAGSGALLAAFEGHAHTARVVEFLPDGRLVSGGEDGTAKLWRPAAPERARIVDVGDEIDGLAISPDGAVIATGTSNGEVLLWRGLDEPASLGNRHTAPVTAVAFTDGGRGLVSGGEDGEVIVSRADGTELRRLTVASHVRAIAVAPDGDLLAAAGDDGAVRIWSLPEGAVIRELAGAEPANALAFVDGTRIAVGDAGGTVTVWAIADGRATTEPVSIGDAVLALATDGARLAAGGDGDTPMIWPVDDPRAAIAVEGPTSVVVAMKLSSDGARLITGGVDGGIRVWDVVTGKLLGSRAGHVGPILPGGLALGGDERLVSAGADQTLRVWDLHTDHRSADEIAAFLEAHVPWRRDAADQVRRVTAVRGGAP